MRKATFGSTTYDEARDAADPTWSGASWYGPTSGEYWQVNPREYADPRKHGPEYLARAAATAAAATERRAGQEQRPAPEGAPEPARPTGRQAAWTPPPARSQGAEASTGPTGADGPTGAAGAPEAAAAGTTGAAEAAGMVAGSQDLIAGLTGVTLAPGARRIVRALAAWPPLGVVAATLIGEATGCASFDAACTAPADLYPWFAQVAIVLALLAAPAVARILSGGTAAVAVLAVPVAAALSAGGATYDRSRGSAALMAVLAVAWAGGVGAMLLRRRARGPVP